MGSSAASEAAAAAAATDGPVLSMMNKRLRALRKKHNRIIQMEESLAKGKTLHAEQEEVLRSKPAVLTLIDEYEKLRQPLASAVQEELSRATAPPSPRAADDAPASASASAVEDLIGLLYFGCLFDVKPQSEFTATMLTRTHERGCCLTYDYVTDDATELLGERDLDAISALGGLVTSRPASAGVSHKNALQGCVEHARLWLGRSDQPIHPGASITYAELREKLNKIMASDYVTTTPEMKATVDVAAAVEQYNNSQVVQVSEATVVPVPYVKTEDAVTHYHEEQDTSQEVQEEFHETEISPDQSSPVDEPHDDDGLNLSEDVLPAQQELQNPEAGLEEEHNQQDADQKDQQYIPRRPYPNQRGVSRGVGGVGGRRGGYPNGRGGRGSGRGGGGSYQNGRSQYYDPGYYPRNYYNTRGRGVRSGGSALYSNHSGAAEGGGLRAVNVE